MAELAALGLASNVISFISFAGDLISKGHEIYNSADGSLIENLALETVTRSLQDLSSGLSLGRDKATGRLTNTEKQLQELCDECRGISKQLLGVIGQLKAKGSHQIWTSFRQALSSAWKKSEIEELESRLERYRRQLDTTLLVWIREYIQKGNNGRGATQRKSQNASLSTEETSKWQAEVIDLLRQNNWQLKDKNDMAMFSMQLSSITNDQRQELFQSQILERLRFTEMEDRLETIAEAHKKTFDWIFYDGQEYELRQNQSPSPEAAESVSNPIPTRQWSNFPHWLRGEETLYWITGKAGSGKSTLMKYISAHDRTGEHLSQWAKGSPLITGGHYFWNSGTNAMQMSKLGLLQTLLHQSVQNSPERIPKLFPDRWKSYELFGGDLRPWSMPELVHAFNTLITDDMTKFAFFIDGLDEFEGSGPELVKFILELSSRRNIKICVASRPWLVFEDAFKR